MKRDAKTISDAIVDRLFEYMESQGLTQYALSQKSGVPYPTVKTIMQRRTKSVDFKTVMLLCRGLGVTVSQFTDCDDFMSENIILD